MIPSFIEFALSIIFVLIGGAICLILCFKTERMILIALPLVIFMPLGLGLAYESNIDKINEDKIKLSEEKAHIDLLSCKSLGSYIIQNSNNGTSEYNDYDSVQTKTYKYAEAKYLVCTHRGIS